MKRKIRPDEDSVANSPWNIATDFTVDMSFSAADIAGMLREYASEHEIEMDFNTVGDRIFYYTNGYPFLVSKLCKMLDEKEEKDWTAEGVDEVETQLLAENNTLFEDLCKNILNDNALHAMISDILLEGAQVGYEPNNPVIKAAKMYGIIQPENGKVRISNIIFETMLTNLLISLSSTRPLAERYASSRSLFIRDEKLDKSVYEVDGKAIAETIIPFKDEVE